MKAPWYTLEETQHKLELTQSELFYAIEQKELMPILFSPLRPFLGFSAFTADHRVGCVHFSYQGPLKADQALLQKLAKGHQGSFYSRYHLLDTDGISNVGYSNPFESEMPNAVVTDWIPGNRDETENDTYIVVAMPNETRSVASAVRLAAELFAKDSAVSSEEGLKRISNIPYDYNWRHNGKWVASDMRIASSEIDRFQSPPEETIVENAPDSSRQRTNLLHELFLRIMKEHQGIKARELWQLIRDNEESIPPRYDKDSIITSINASELLWQSNFTTEQYFDKKSLSSRMSKLKKRL